MIIKRSSFRDFEDVSFCEWETDESIKDQFAKNQQLQTDKTKVESNKKDQDEEFSSETNKEQK